jgi:GxxExxY protein
MMIEDDLTEKIIGSAFKVYNTLGSGFLESVYKKALLIELKVSGLQASEEQPVNVFYRAQAVGLFFADIIVNSKVIVELKAVETLNKVHEIQLVNYLKATGISIGLLINFGPNDLQVKRKYKDPVHPENPVILSNFSNL